MRDEANCEKMSLLLSLLADTQAFSPADRLGWIVQGVAGVQEGASSELRDEELGFVAGGINETEPDPHKGRGR